MTKEEIAAYNKAYYIENREKITTYSRLYSAENKAKVKAYSQTKERKYTMYKSSAKKRNISFDLSFEEFISFWEKPCSYCGCEITTIGIDRIGSDIGYTKSNCKSCCITCNIMKLDHSEAFWVEHMNRILNHLKKE